MSSVSSVSGGYTYANGASGYKINSAADDAAGLAITEKENTQIKGCNQGAENIAAGRDMLNVADGGLSNVADYLQRMRELSVQAANATVTDSDRAMMQKEVDQLKQGINDIANNTQFNTKNLLNGDNQSFNIATDGNGNAMEVNTPNTVLSELGIEDFDLTSNNDIGALDKALEKVNSSRAEIGGQTNALEFAYNRATSSSLHQSEAYSRKKDLDIGDYVSEQKKKETLQQYQTFMQKKKMEDEKQRTSNLLNGLS